MLLLHSCSSETSRLHQSGRTQITQEIKKSRSNFMETFLSKNFRNRTLCNALLDLVTFLQFRKREKHQWKTNGITLFHGSFSRFLNCTNGTKPRKASHM